METNLNFIREVFNIFDKESDGSISTKDLPSICKYFFKENLTDSEMAKLLKLDSIDTEIKIRFEDFYLSLYNKELGINKQTIDEAFQHFDKKSTGKISKQELKAIIESEHSGLTQEEISQIIEQYSLTSNDELDYNKLIEDYFS